MVLFAQKFAPKKQESDGNSIQQEVILDAMKQAAEDLAVQVSQETSSAANIESILDNKIVAPDTKTEAETLLEQEIETNSLEKLLGALEVASSIEELSALMQQYEELLVSWSEKASLLRSDKHLKEYLAITAALNMLQRVLQNPELLKGKQLSELLQSSLKLQERSIADQAKQMQAQNQKLHEQVQAFTKQLSSVEKSLLASIEALKKDPCKLTSQELQVTLKQLQESLKQVQEIKEKIVNGKPLDFKEMLEGLQRIQTQNQKLIESGKLSELVMQTMRASQQSLQQVMQQTNVVQHLQQNISALHAAQMQQVKHNAGQIMQVQINTLIADKINTQSQKLKEQEKLLPKQLSVVEQSLKSAIESLHKDSGKLSQKEQQEGLKQLQESLKRIQELKEGKDGKQVAPKEILESLQKINSQNQKLLESGKLSESALNAIRQSQQLLQQTLQQTKSIHRLQENVANLRVIQAQQTKLNDNKTMQILSNNVAGKMSPQLQKLADQELQLKTNLSKTEQSLKSAMEVLQKDPGKLSQREQQESLKQLQESFKRIQELREGKQQSPKELLENLQKIQQQTPKLTENGKLSENALNALNATRQSQQALQQSAQSVVAQQQKRAENSLPLHVRVNLEAAKSSNLAVQQKVGQMQSVARVGQVVETASQLVNTSQQLQKAQVQAAQAQSARASNVIEATRQANTAQQVQVAVQKQAVQPGQYLTETAKRPIAFQQQVTQAQVQTQSAARAGQVVETARQVVNTTQQLQQVQAVQAQSARASNVVDTTRHVDTVQQVQIAVQKQAAQPGQYLTEAAKGTEVIQQAVQPLPLQTQAASARDMQQNNVLQINSPIPQPARQEQVAVLQRQQNTTMNQQASDSSRAATKEVWAEMVANAQITPKSEAVENAKKSWTQQCKQQIAAKGAAMCVCG